MLDTRFVEQHVDLVKATCRRRGLDIDVDEIVRLERERRSITGQLDEARRESKHLARRWQTATDGEAIEREARAIKAREARLTQHLGEVERTLHERASWLPNLLDPRVPDGGEEHNVVVRQVGVVPSFDFTPRSHGELGELLDLIDIPRGVRAAGTRFYLLKNQLVRMRLALITMFLDRVQPLGFQVICPPFLARERTLYASGYLPFARDDTFRLRDDDLSLIGTSEQALLGIHLDEMLSELPLLYLGDSMCFRTEVGSAGRDNAGILRVHQFYKLEQIVYCHPDEAETWHQRCLEHEEWLLRELAHPLSGRADGRGRHGRAGQDQVRHRGLVPVARHVSGVDLQHEPGGLPDAPGQHPL
jgi:seryl-tRNA synthetase